MAGTPAPAPAGTTRTVPDPSITAAQDWSAVAAAWDAHVDDVDAPSTEATAALLDLVAIRSGDRVLELAAGPGSLGATLANLAGPGGTVVLSDIAPGMVDVAKRRNQGRPTVTVEVLDAAAIDRPAGSFDVVVSRMGLMFVPDPRVAFAEMRRVLAPGGRLGALTWGSMEHNPWMTCVGMAAMMNGLVTAGPPVGPGGIFSLANPDEVRSLAEGAGFTDVTVEELPVMFRSESIETHVSRVGSLAGPLALVFEQASPEQLAAVHRTASVLAAPYVTTQGLELPGRAVLLSGRYSEGR
jgi:ubiquinone/menaquinone biosynthesis C-methylase UbiE